LSFGKSSACTLVLSERKRKIARFQVSPRPPPPGPTQTNFVFPGTAPNQKIAKCLKFGPAPVFSAQIGIQAPNTWPSFKAMGKKWLEFPKSPPPNLAQTQGSNPKFWGFPKAPDRPGKRATMEFATRLPPLGLTPRGGPPFPLNNRKHPQLPIYAFWKEKHMATCYQKKPPKQKCWRAEQVRFTFFPGPPPPEPRKFPVLRRANRCF